MQLLSEKMSATLDSLVGECFSMNRYLDRCMSLLSVKFHMKHAEPILHVKLAHAFPGDKFADGISGYKDKRDTLTVYPVTPEASFDANNPYELIEEFYKRMITFQNDVYDATEQAIEEGDHSTKVFLDGLTATITDYIDQAQTLVDVFGDYGRDPFHIQMLDANIENYMSV